MLTLQRTNQVFEAFADSTRLRLLNLLTDGEVCVCHLVAVLGMPQPKISRHLAVLRESGLVECRKIGRNMMYSLAPPSSPLHERLVGCVAECFREVEVLEEDLARLRHSRRC